MEKLRPHWCQGEAKTITLKDNETAKIFGLSETDEYTVTEASYADDGYTTTIDNEEKLTATGTIKKIQKQEQPQRMATRTLPL